MKTLLLKDDDVQVLQSNGILFQGPATKRRKGSKAQPIPMIQDGGVRQKDLHLRFIQACSSTMTSSVYYSRWTAGISGDEEEEEEPNKVYSDHGATDNEDEEKKKIKSTSTST